MIFILYLIFGAYCLFNVGLLYTWSRMHQKEKFFTKSERDTAFVSVIIPARNEEANILALLQDLNKQVYPFSHFEVFVANDNSTDETATLVEAFKKEANYTLQLVNLPSDRVSSPKKRAILTCINQAQGSIIMTTDGDCRVLPTWIEAVANRFVSTNSQLVSSPVTFIDEQTFWSKIQIIEFASLIGAGACSMFAGRPNMCNGANLAYKKQAFLEVGGFAGNEQLASGDDEFLMHKIAKVFPNQLSFLASQDAIVKTTAQPTLRHFYNQRKRWASKWKQYDDWKIIALAIFVFSVNFGFVCTLVGGLFSWISRIDFTLLVLLKCLAEWLFLSKVVRFLGHQALRKYIGIVQIIYPFYVSFFGLIAQGKGYQWKGRRLE